MYRNVYRKWVNQPVWGIIKRACNVLSVAVISYILKPSGKISILLFFSFQRIYYNYFYWNLFCLLKCWGTDFVYSSDFYCITLWPSKLIDRSTLNVGGTIPSIEPSWNDKGKNENPGLLHVTHLLLLVDHTCNVTYDPRFLQCFSHPDVVFKQWIKWIFHSKKKKKVITCMSSWMKPSSLRENSRTQVYSSLGSKIQ